jgi:hypothetical protein
MGRLKLSFFFSAAKTPLPPLVGLCDSGWCLPDKKMVLDRNESMADFESVLRREWRGHGRMSGKWE